MGRLGAAIVASLAAHVFLIYGWALPDVSRSGSRETVIHARLDTPHKSFLSPSAQAVSPSVPRMHSPAVPTHELPAESSDAAPPRAQSTVPAEAERSGDAALAKPVTEPVPAIDDAAMVAMPDPVLYEVRELDVYPRALRPIKPAYPASAREAQLAGSVTLKVMIDEGGRVVSAAVVDAEPGGVFDQAAQEAIAETAFYPAQRNGRTVRSQLLIKVEFDPRVAP